MLVICQACYYRRDVQKLKRGKLVCSNCGSHAARRVIKTKIWMLEKVVLLNPTAARERTYGGLLWWARHKGYKDGWAAIKFRLIFGEWPKYTEAVIIVTSSELIRWIDKQNEIYKRMMRKQEKENGGEHFRARARPVVRDFA